MMTSTSLLAPAVLLLTPLLVGAANVTLVKDARPLADIVLHKDAIPATKLAATDFQKHIKLISGAELAIVDQPGGRTPVYIGDSDYSRRLGVSLADIKGSGYKVVVKDNYVVLAGRDIQHKPLPMKLPDWQEFAGGKYGLPWITPGMAVPELGIAVKDDTGSLYATSELLEQLGVRWYMPYENGTVIPKLKDVVVRTQDLTKETNYKQRQTTFYGGHLNGKLAASTLWLKHLRYGNSVSVDESPHGLVSMLGGEEQRREHPEYFAMAQGKMIDAEHGGKPRLTDPQFRQSSLHYADKVFQLCPDLWALSLGMPDGLGRIDERDALLFPPGEKRGHVLRLCVGLLDLGRGGAEAAASRQIHDRPFLHQLSGSAAEFGQSPGQRAARPGHHHHESRAARQARLLHRHARPVAATLLARHEAANL
jgi:hypothetical protein